ncbi:MAG: molybdate transport system permease protein [Verrucomicrobiales bacterium]|jgi:molybdate transport system permease protein
MPEPRRIPSDGPFFYGLIVIAGAYLLLIISLLLADAQYVSLSNIREALADDDIQSSIWLTLITCTVTALLSVLVAVPTGYLLSRFRFPGKRYVDALLDIPILLPPLVIGLSLLILFHQVNLFGKTLEDWFAWAFQWITIFRPDIRPGVTFKVPAVILAQFTVSCAFAVRTMKTTFDQIHPRHEHVALTLGCNRSQAFWLVLLPQAWRGILTGGTLAWARALGEFGPILVFAGATRGRTEVLSTTVFLEINIGNLQGAVAVSLLMILLALAVILVVRTLGERTVLGTDTHQGGDHHA